MTSTLKIDNKLIALGKRYSDAILEVANTRNQSKLIDKYVANHSELYREVIN